jgi:hypothetical protein
MRIKTLRFGFAALSFCLASPSYADNIANCEIVILQTVEDESGRGGAQVASYGPADDFLGSVYNDDIDIVKDIGGLPIQAVMCKRMDIVPTKNDFKILATGIPLFLSQSFDSQNSDLISLFYKEDEFHHTYSGPGLTEETAGLIDTRLVEFNSMEHGLASKEADTKAPEENAEEKEEDASEDSENSASEESLNETDLGDEDSSKETPSDETSEAETETEADTIDKLAEGVQEEELTKELLTEAVDKELAEISPISSTEEDAAPLEEPRESE